VSRRLGTLLTQTPADPRNALSPRLPLPVILGLASELNLDVGEAIRR
jgi:hypothetical protein